MQGEMNNHAGTPDAAEIDFLDYLEIVLKRKKVVIKATAIALVLSAIIVMILPKTYQATARILPPQQDQGLVAMMMSGGSGGLAGLAGNLLGTGTSADQFASIMQSERMMGAIIDRFKLMEEYKKDFRVDMYEKMSKIVDITAGKKDGIITITVEDEDPKKAADIANAYIGELNKVVAELSTSAAGGNRVFLEGRLARARADLTKAEDAMKAFQVKYNAINVPDQAKASIEGVALLKAQIAVQEGQLSAVRSQLMDSAPEVQTIKATIGKLKAQLAGLEGTGTGAIPSVGSVPALGVQQVRLLREFKTQEMIVELLTKQYELAKLTEAKDVNSIQVIQKAEVPDKKYKPKRRNIVLGATFVVFILSVSYVMVLNYVETMPENERKRWQRIRAVATGKTRAAE
jgi:tyrosine-protein kinase Etk/Wzc